MAAIWRWSHMALSCLGSVVIVVASFTGIALGYHETISAARPGVPSENIKGQPVARLIERIENAHEQVFEISTDAQCRIYVEALTKGGELSHFLANPDTGASMARVEPDPMWVQWCRGLHRSLFFKTPGRIIVAVGAILLLLISISGIFILIQFKGNRPQLLIPYRDRVQSSHTWGGIFLLVPTVICAITALTLSFQRLDVFSSRQDQAVLIQKMDLSSKVKPWEFEIFNQTPVRSIKAIKFPVFDDLEEPFLLETIQSEFHLHPCDGHVMATIQHPLLHLINGIASPLHTGEGSVLWSIILMVTAIGLLYFTWSGFKITWNRIKKKAKQKTKAEDCEILLLVASETGSTWGFAEALKKSAADIDVDIHIDRIDEFKPHERIKQVIFMVATTGYGDPPEDAVEYKAILERVPEDSKIEVSVLAFGSHVYPEFAKFGDDLHAHLKTLSWPEMRLPLHKVDSGSWTDFESWRAAWGKAFGFDFKSKVEVDHGVGAHTLQIKRIERVEDLVKWTLKGPRAFRGQSGDHLGIRTPNGSEERLYSLAKMEDGDYSIVFKVHPHGACSSHMGQRTEGQQFEARLASNPAFSMPEGQKGVTLISNGTGIGPFLGFLAQAEEKGPARFYWGCRGQMQQGLFESEFHRAQEGGEWEHFEVVHSREGHKKRVQTSIRRDKTRLVQNMANGGAIMVCGALQMQSDIEAILEEALLEEGLETLEQFKERGQFLADCYG